MKKYLLLLIAAFGLIVSGCNKDESDPLLVERLSGPWLLSSLNTGWQEFTDSDPAIVFTITFTGTGTWATTPPETTVFSGSGTYTITGTTLLLEEDTGETATWEVQSLTETQAEFYWANYDYTLTFLRPPAEED